MTWTSAAAAVPRRKPRQPPPGHNQLVLGEARRSRTPSSTSPCQLLALPRRASRPLIYPLDRSTVSLERIRMDLMTRTADGLPFSGPTVTNQDRLPRNPGPGATLPVGLQ